MSYSTTEAKNERAEDIYRAIKSYDLKELQRLALLEKSEGNDETAETLFAILDDCMETAREVEDEMRRDDEEDYKEEREAYYAETYNNPSEGRY